ncbi:MAG: YkgJ family cysteine cluster protein [Promethearchaeia archaeon]
MECDNCGKCCRNLDAIMLLPSDYKRLKNVDKELTKNIKAVDGVYYLLLEEGHICPYFDKSSKRCTIYEWRPKTCRAYPFSFRKDPLGQQNLMDLQIYPRNLYLTLCERFWTYTQKDVKEGAKAIFRMRREKTNLGIISSSKEPTQKEIKIQKFEQSLKHEKEEKKFPFDLYLKMIQKDKNLFLIFLKLFDAYFDAVENQKEEYDKFVEKYIIKLYSQPDLLEEAFEELKNRWSKEKKKNLNFSFII